MGPELSRGASRVNAGPSLFINQGRPRGGWAGSFGAGGGEGGRGEGAPFVIPSRFTEDVRADFGAQNRLDFRRIVRIGVVMGWPSQSRPLKGSPCDLRGFGSCERQFRRREPTEPKRCRPFP